MFRKTCAKCKSPNVNVLKSFNGWKTLHQFCRDCGTDQTAIGLKKARITRYKPRTASKTRKSTQSTTYAIGLVIWAIFSVLAYGATAYAEMSTITYEATSTPVEIVVEKKPETIVNKLETKAEIREYVLSEAKKAGVHVAKIDHIVENESHYNPEAVGDKDVPCTNKKSPLYGKGAHARGLWQITKCWYPDITDEQAHDIEWSTKWALQIIAHSKNDCITQWTTCRLWYRM